MIHLSGKAQKESPAMGLFNGTTASERPSPDFCRVIVRKSAAVYPAKSSFSRHSKSQTQQFVWLTHLTLIFMAFLVANVQFLTVQSCTVCTTCVFFFFLCLPPLWNFKASHLRETPLPLCKLTNSRWHTGYIFLLWRATTSRNQRACSGRVFPASGKQMPLLSRCTRVQFGSSASVCLNY